MRNNFNDKLLEDAILAEIDKGTTLGKVCDKYQVDHILVMTVIEDLKKLGHNVDIVPTNDGDMEIKNYGHRKLIDPVPFMLENNNRNIRIVLLSDTHMGSRYEQLEALNNVYYNAYEAFKPDFFLHCGDLSAGVYSASQQMLNQTLFARSFDEQVDHIVNFYPYIENTPTYFITGERDEKHLKQDQANDIGVAVSDARPDLVYLGQFAKNLHIYDIYKDKKIKFRVEHMTGSSPYTVSYPSQRELDAMRSDDKPNFLIHAHWLTSADFMTRGVKLIQVPGLVGEIPSRKKPGSTNIGAWYLEIQRDSNMDIVSQKETRVTYYKQEPIDNHQKVKALKIGGKNGKL